MSDNQEVEVVDTESGEIHSAALIHVDPRNITDSLALFDIELAAQAGFAERYDKACDAVIGPNDVQEEGGRKFKKKSAWRKLGRVFHISTQVVKAETWWEGPEDDRHCVSRCIVRATAPWGQYSEAVGKCSTRESRFMAGYPVCPVCESAMWDNREDDKGDDHFNCKRCKYKLYEGSYDPELIGRRVPSAGARMKADHDCEATAETRATNRAVSNLIAAGEVSYDEIEGSEVSQRGSTHGNGQQNSSGGGRRNDFTLETPCYLPKHKGKPWSQVLEEDASYVGWAIHNATSVSDEGKELLRKELEKRKGSQEGSDDSSQGGSNGKIDTATKRDIILMWNDLCKEAGIEDKDKKMQTLLDYIAHCIPNSFVVDLADMSEAQAEIMVGTLTRQADATLDWLKKESAK